MPLVLSFSLGWLRVALVLYLAGMASTVAAAWTRRDSLFPLARATVAAAFIFHLVSLVEAAAAVQYGSLTLYREITGLLAFVVAAFFLTVYRMHSPRALGLLVVPLICLLTAGAAFAPPSPGNFAPAAGDLLRNRWIYVHVVLILLGYAGLVLAVASGVLYLVAERTLKSKTASTSRRLLPPLETLDHIGYRSLLIGFPLLTVGLVIGAYLADQLFAGNRLLGDPSVLLAALAWCLYLVLLFARWSAGWRGRRTAYLALACFGVALAGWFANGMSRMHSIFLR